MTRLTGATPMLRIFDEGKAKAFYLDYLGFGLDWEHRFEPGLPLYMQVSLGEVALHLTEHHGDCCPGAAVRIETAGVEEWHRQLLGRDYPFMRPGLETTPWHTRETTLIDPFGNRLIFFERTGQA